MVRYVYDFTEGGRDMADLLGGKGSNPAEMTRLGLPVPTGFTLATEACRAFLKTGNEPAGLWEEVSAHLEALEASAGRSLGQPDDPLLLSVRSGAKFSMPGMMETILDIVLAGPGQRIRRPRSGPLGLCQPSHVQSATSGRSTPCSRM